MSASAVPKRLIIADDQRLMLEGIVRLLPPDFTVIATVTDGEALMREAARLQPDVVLLDVELSGINGIEAARRITRQVPEAKVVFVTQCLDRSHLHAAFAAGAVGYVAKQSAVAELVHAIRLALTGRYFVTPLAGDDVAQAVGRDPTKNPAGIIHGRLTPRQREVLELIAEGKSTKQIAAFLGVTTKTAEYHRATLMDQLGLRTIADLTRYVLSGALDIKVGSIRP